jgi:nucleoside 2-deoxyribosyltransferase
MDEIKNGGICPLTGWEISNADHQGYYWTYNISCGFLTFSLWVSMECEFNPELSRLKHIIRWLVVSEKIKSIKDSNAYLSPSVFLITPKSIQNVISETFLPNTPKEKSEQLLFLLKRVFPNFKGEIQREDLFNLSFFETIEEFKVYFSYLVDSDYIKIDQEPRLMGISESQNKNAIFLIVEFKFKGIQQLSQLEENGRNSKNCFIAMSFSDKPEIVAIKEAIKSAVSETKYHPIIINEKHIESDRTINDAIIAEIKRAKFVIADFTEQKSGVYFEAGFALGLGIPVIYCCEKEDFDNNSHFDVNHYPHILYKSPEQLRKGLIDKIGAWID